MIAAFLISWLAIVFAGYFVTPIIPAISPEPIVSGYIGFFSGVISLGIIPLVLLIWLLFKVIWGYKVGPRIRRTTFGIWIVCFFMFCMTVLFSAKNFVHEYSDTEVISEAKINVENKEPFVLNMKSSYEEVLKDDIVKVNLDEMFISQGNIYLRNVHLNLIPTNTDILSVEKTRRATAANKGEAEKNMRQPVNDFSLENMTLELSDYSKLSKGDKYRRQCIEYTVKIPVGTTVVINGYHNDLINRSDFAERHKIQLEKPYTMTQEGLVLVEAVEI